MKKYLIAAAFIFAFTGGLFAAPTLVQADPITCPNGQHSEHFTAGWFCVNNGGNTSNADQTKNPND